MIELLEILLLSLVVSAVYALLIVLPIMAIVWLFTGVAVLALIKAGIVVTLIVYMGATLMQIFKI